MAIARRGYFDRAVPPIEAIELYGTPSLPRLAMDYKVPFFVVSGNHDGRNVLKWDASMLSQSVSIFGLSSSRVDAFEFEGTDGKVAICPMPLVNPGA